jgi:hypothetical protein
MDIRKTLLLFLFLWLWLCSQKLLAQTINVTGTTPAALISAINQANNHPSLTITINLPTNTVYLFTSSVGNFMEGTTNWGPTALPSLKQNKRITINGRGSTIRRSLTAPKFRIFSMAARSELILNSLTVENGSSDFQGGGVLLGYKSYFEANNCNFRNNQTFSTTPRGGGAIMTRSLCVVKLNKCEFSNNFATTRGGGICILLSDLEVTDSKFLNNKTGLTAVENLGGGIYVDGARGDNGTVSIDNVLLDGNEAGDAAAAIYIYLYNNNQATVKNIISRNNRVFGPLGRGGGFWYANGNDVIPDPEGVYSYTAIGNTCKVTLSNSAIYNNFARTSGGGVFFAFNPIKSISGTGSAEVVNCTFVANRADEGANGRGYGGAIYNLDLPLRVTNCTFAQNFARSSGGAMYGGKSNQVTVINSIFAYNISDNNGSGANVRNHCNQTYQGQKNIEFPAPKANNPNDGPCSPIAGSIYLDPRLGPLQDNGGLTPTMRITMSSPAYNAGVNVAGVPNTDQRGVIREVVGLEKPDIGAFEINSGASINASPSNLNGTLNGVAQINLTWDDNSTAPNESGFTIQRSKNNLFNFTDLATVGADVETYQDNNLEPNTIYYYHVKANDIGDDTWSNIAGVYVPFATGYCDNSMYQPEVITNPNVILGNGTPASCDETALQGALDAGGKIVCNCGNAPITISLTKELKANVDNTVFDGGGLVTISGNNDTRILNVKEGIIFTLQNTKLIDGKCPQSGGLFNESGGAILVGSGVTGNGGGELRLFNSSFVNNRITRELIAERGGGAVYTYALKNLIVVGCTFTNNRANVGGAIAGIGSQLTILNSTFENNFTTSPNDNFLSGVGGAIYVDGIDLWDPSNNFDHKITLCGTNFIGNKARHQGGALFSVISDGKRNQLNIDRCSFENNQLTSPTNGLGGAIYHIEDDFVNNIAPTDLIIQNSTFTGNTCQRQGGALWAIIGGKGDIINNTFENNSVIRPNAGLGGAIALSSATYGGDYRLINNTIANNHSAHFGGGVFASANNVVNLQNTIFSNNTSDFEFEGHQLAGPITFTGTKNIQFPWTRWNGTADNVVPGRIGTGTDPLLMPLANNGGITKTMALTEDLPNNIVSFAIDAGNPAGAPSTDQRGLTRVPTIDIGAYESSAVITVGPVITSFAPPTGNIGSSVEISGSGFTGATSVTFNGVTASAFTVVDANTIQVTVPNLATTGKIGVNTPQGSATSTDDFIVSIPVPTITSFNPIFGPAGTTVVTITGTDLAGANALTINGVAITNFTVVDNVTITFIVPNNATTGKIAVTTAGGIATSTNDFDVTPSITDFSPKLGPIGTVVTVTGTNLLNINTLAVGSIAGTSLTPSGDGTSLTFVVAPTTVSDLINIDIASNIYSTTENFVVIEAPTIDSPLEFDPTSGIAGTEVTIYGNNFTWVTSVSFGGVSTTSFQVVDDNTIKVNVPDNALTGKITVTNPAGNDTSTGDFTVIPSISDFTPTQGGNGTIVTITGTNLLNASQVRFGGPAGIPASNVVINLDGTSLTAQVTTGASGKIQIDFPTITNVESEFDFTFIPPPTITSVSPAAPTNVIAGQTITVTGTNFTNATSLQINGAQILTFDVNVTGDQLTFVVPDDASSGSFPVVITTPGGSATSNAFNLVKIIPSIYSFTPDKGVVDNIVNIQGANFTGVTQVKFFNGNDNATAFTVVSPTQINATVPPYSSVLIGRIHLDIVTDLDIEISNDDFEYLLPVTIISATPNQALRGDEITVIGTNFVLGNTDVFINGVQATDVNVISKTLLKVVVPPTAPFTFAPAEVLRIATLGGDATTPFDVIDNSTPPTIISFTPDNGFVGTPVSINGTNFVKNPIVEFSGPGATFIPATSFSVNNDGNIVANVPTGAITGPIRVSNDDGDYASDNLIPPANFIVNVIPAPTITSFTPTGGNVNAGNITVVITGTNFTGATEVRVNGSAAAVSSFVVNNSTRITAIINNTATTGRIRIFTPGGDVQSANDFIVTTLLSWDGSQSTDWSDPDNWTPNQVPTSAETVLINNTVPNMPVIDGESPIISDLTIATGATLTVNNANILTINGLSDNNGTFNINGTANFNADFINDGIFIGNGSAVFNAGFNNRSNFDFSGTATLKGNILNTGTFDANNTSTNTIILDGAARQNLPAGMTTFRNLQIDNIGDVRLMSNIQVTGDLIMQQGDLYLNGRTIDLGTTGRVINENNLNRIRGAAGSIVATRTGPLGFLAAGQPNRNIANLGATITIPNTANVTGITIRRGHTQRVSGPNEGILRYYVISVSGQNDNLDATLQFGYFIEELAGLTENQLILNRFNTELTPARWENRTNVGRTGAVGNALGTLTLAGIAKFSEWTASMESAPLPINLISFVGERLNETEVELTWKFANQENVKGFEVEQSADLQSFTKIAYVDAARGSDIRNYQFLDKNAKNARYYRLQQIGVNGLVKSSSIIKVDNESQEVALFYPNPVRDQVSLRPSLPLNDTFRLLIFNPNGEKVFESQGNLADNQLKINQLITNLPAGLYTVRLYVPTEAKTYISKLIKQ